MPRTAHVFRSATFSFIGAAGLASALIALGPIQTVGAVELQASPSNPVQLAMDDMNMQSQGSMGGPQAAQSGQSSGMQSQDSMRQGGMQPGQSGRMGGGMMMDDNMGMPQSQGQTSRGSGVPSQDTMGQGNSRSQMGRGGMMMDNMMHGRMEGMPGMIMEGMPGMIITTPNAVDLTDRIEGRIAFLKAELQITDAQITLWNAFAEALRSGRQHLIEARKLLTTGDKTNSPSDLEQYERHLMERLEATKSARGAFERLYPALDDGQKQVANELLIPFIATF